MLLLLVAVFLVTVLCLRFWKICNYWNERGVPNLGGVPFFGNMLPIVLRQKSLIDVATEVYHSAPNSRYE